MRDGIIDGITDGTLSSEGTKQAPNIMETINNTNHNIKEMCANTEEVCVNYKSEETHKKIANEAEIPAGRNLRDIPSLEPGYYRYINFSKKNGENVPLYYYDGKTAYYVVGKFNDEKFSLIDVYYCIDSNGKIIDKSKECIVHWKMENGEVKCYTNAYVHGNDNVPTRIKLTKRVSSLVEQAEKKKRNSSTENEIKYKYGEALKIYEENNRLIQEDSERFLKILSKYLGIRIENVDDDDSSKLQLNIAHLCLDALKFYEKDKRKIRNENNFVVFLGILSGYLSMIGDNNPSGINLSFLCREALKKFNMEHKLIQDNYPYFLIILNKYKAISNVKYDELIDELVKYV